MFNFMEDAFGGYPPDNRHFEQPSANEVLMGNVKARLKVNGGLEQPEGTIYLSFPEVIVRFQELAGCIAACVYTENGEFIGSITPDGEISYAQRV